MKAQVKMFLCLIQRPLKNLATSQTFTSTSLSETIQSHTSVWNEQRKIKFDDNQITTVRPHNTLDENVEK